jgi:hypothetical protein
MFPVRYELNSYINLLRNSVFKGLSCLQRGHLNQTQLVHLNVQVNYAYTYSSWNKCMC